MNDFETTITRIDNPKPNLDILEEMYVERGTQADWDLLSHLHYKLSTLPVGAAYWRLRFRNETIGVCVMGMSRPLLKERHAIFPLLCPGRDSQASNIQRYRHINDNFRTCGRFVVDTMFRSSGCAYRFLNLAARLHGYKYCEIISSMARFNTFAQRAGFSMSKPIRSMHYDKGLRFMRRWFENNPVDVEALITEFNSFSPSLQNRVKQELRDFYYDNSPLEKTGSRRFYSSGVVDNWTVRRTIIKIQGLCFSSPIYGFYKNPGIILPKPETIIDRLPLLSYDCQIPSEPIEYANLINDVRLNRFFDGSIDFGTTDSDTSQKKSIPKPRQKRIKHNTVTEKVEETNP